MFTHEQMGFRAQSVHHTGNFYSDISGTDYRHAFWHVGQIKEAIGVDTVFRSRNVRVAWATAGGDQDVIRRDLLAVHFHGMIVNKTRETFDHINLGSKRKSTRLNSSHITI